MKSARSFDFALATRRKRGSKKQAGRVARMTFEGRVELVIPTLRQKSAEEWATEGTARETDTLCVAIRLIALTSGGRAGTLPSRLDGKCRAGGGAAPEFFTTSTQGLPRFPAPSKPISVLYRQTIQ